MTKISIEDAVKDLAGLIARARAGEEIVIVDAKEMLARIEVVERQAPAESVAGKRRKAGLLKDSLVVPARLLEPMTEAELREFWGGEAL